MVVDVLFLVALRYFFNQGDVLLLKYICKIKEFIKDLNNVNLVLNLEMLQAQLFLFTFFGYFNFGILNVFVEILSHNARVVYYLFCLSHAPYKFLLFNPLLHLIIEWVKYFTIEISQDHSVLKSLAYLVYNLDPGFFKIKIHSYCFIFIFFC